jgi:hypothetical protein
VSKILLFGVARNLRGILVLNLPRQDFYHHDKFGQKGCNGVEMCKVKTKLLDLLYGVFKS